MKARTLAATRRVRLGGIRFFAIAGVVLLVLLLYRFWFGESGWFALRQLEADVATQDARTTALAERNRALATEVRALKAGPEAVEGRARTDLGMVKEGETLYLVVDEAPATGPEDANEPEPAP